MNGMYVCLTLSHTQTSMVFTLFALPLYVSREPTLALHDGCARLVLIHLPTQGGEKHNTARLGLLF